MPAPVAAGLPATLRRSVLRATDGVAEPRPTVACLGVAIVAAVVVARSPQLGLQSVLLVGGGLGFLGLMWLAVRRFEDYLVVLFVVRTALDYLKPPGSYGLTDPTSIVGLTFLVLGGAWLWVEGRRGALVRPSRLTWAVSALSALALFSPVFAASKSDAFQSALKVASFAVMLAVLEQLFRRDPARRERLLRAVLWSLTLPALVSVLQLARGGTDQFIEVGRVRGTFAHPNPFATYLVLVLVLVLALRSAARGPTHTLYSAVACCSGALLLFTYSRAAWVAAIIGVAIVAVERDRRLLKVLAVGGVVLLLAVPSVLTRLSDLGQEQSGPGDANSLAWRLGYWEELLPLGLRAPVGGIGLDGSKLVTVEELPPHNVFVQAFVELGLPGLVTLLAVIVAGATAVLQGRFYARDRFERALGSAALGIGLGVLLQLLSENLLTQAVSLWYLAVVLAASFANGWTDGIAPAPRRTAPAWLLVQRLLDDRKARGRRPSAGFSESGDDAGTQVRDLVERRKARELLGIDEGDRWRPS